MHACARDAQFGFQRAHRPVLVLAGELEQHDDVLTVEHLGLVPRCLMFRDMRQPPTKPHQLSRRWLGFATCPARTSGLSYWELSDELPHSSDLAVPRGSHWPKIDTPATTPHRFAKETFNLERITQSTEAGEPFWIYSAERCIVDAMRLAHIVGRDVALSALSRYARRESAEPLRLTALARRLGGARRMRDALELILA